MPGWDQDQDQARDQDQDQDAGVLGQQSYQYANDEPEYIELRELESRHPFDPEGGP